MRRGWAVGALVTAGAVMTWPCGPFFPEFEYAPVHEPVRSEAAVERYDAGEIGVVRPRFFREPLVVAYRYLSGVPLSAEEVKALQPPAAPTRTGPADQWTATGRWLAARQSVPNAAQIQYFSQDKTIPGQPYQFFENCLDTAFDTAAATLRDREAKWGAASANVAEWLKGQDEVFENCSKGPAIPAPLAGGDALLVADRQYQIAAAEFYAGQFDAAERDFEAVAANAASPWRDGGRYLAARALIRDGTLNDKAESLRAAEAKLKAVTADPASAKWHDSAHGLVDFIHATLDPQGRIVALGNELMQPGLGPAIRQTMTDYTHLLGRGKTAPAAESEITDWVETFQGGRAEHAAERWRAEKTMPWLVAALASAKPADAAVPDLIAAAQRVTPEAPAYASATYYGIGLATARGEKDMARNWADRALGTKQLDSTVNLLRAERLALARDWDEFLEYGPRKPVGLAYDYLGSDDMLASDPDAAKKTVALDVDFTQPMNSAVPLALWNRAARGAALPRSLQAEIARSGWVRAAILGDAEARPLAERTRELNPAWAAAMNDYLKQTDPAEAHFTAVFWMLRTPGMGAELRSGIGRTTAAGKIDDFRDNWWTVASKAVDAGFLSAAEKTAGEAQAARLKQQAGNAVNYLAAQAVAWAQAHPQDARVPEALHLAVRATRFGQTDKQSTTYSKAAFELLHRRYADSTWAKQTKYWY
jgi:hypothetical protein